MMSDEVDPYMEFRGKTLLIGLCGGIAAYRACDLIRELQRRGAERVIALMTPSATRFISPLTLQSLTREHVYLSEMDIDNHGTPEHIALAQQADAFLVLPATANTLAKLAHGMADDMLATTALTFTGKPLLIAPAMNTRMWLNPLTQKNVEVLAELDHVTMIRPTEGLLACGETGAGHLAEQETILQWLYRATHEEAHAYQGKRVLVTAGGTSEPIDPVRVLSNRSSGKMGVALADEAFAMGAEVTLIATTSVQIPDLDQRPYTVERVEQAAELAASVDAYFNETDYLLMAAAVSDFTVDAAPRKIKRESGDTSSLALSLSPTEDILARVAARKRPEQQVIGFAAESENLLEHARGKLARKGLDAIVANDISQPGIGFQSDDNAVTLLFANGRVEDMARASKPQIARSILSALMWEQEKEEELKDLSTV